MAWPSNFLRSDYEADKFFTQTRAQNLYDAINAMVMGGIQCPFAQFLGDGSDGDLHFTSSTTYDFTGGVQTTSLTIDSGVTVTLTGSTHPYNAFIACTGTVTIHGTLDGNGRGYVGVTGQHGEPRPASTQVGGRSWAIAAGGGGSHSSYSYYGGHWSGGAPGVDGLSISQILASNSGPWLASIWTNPALFDAGGGGGAGNSGASVGDGGAMIVIICDTIEGSGTITANGTGYATYSGGGGGGVILIYCRNNNWSGTMSVNGGSASTSGGAGIYKIIELGGGSGYTLV